MKDLERMSCVSITANSLGTARKTTSQKRHSSLFGVELHDSNKYNDVFSS